MLEQLSHVQALDLQLDELEREKGQTPTELTSLRQHISRLQDSLETLQSEVDALRREVNSNELEIKDLDARRQGAAKAALEATNSKEISQYQNQELQFATRLEELENETLPLIDRLEKLEQERDRLKEQLADKEPELDALIEQEQQRLDALDASIGVQAGERDALARGLDATLLRQYEQIRRSKRGIGLVTIVDNQRCGGCNMRLPIHILQKTQKKLNVRSLTRCPSCGRILWLKSFS